MTNVYEYNYNKTYVYESLDTIKDLDRIESLSIKISKSAQLLGFTKREIVRLLKISEERLSIDAPLYGLNPYIEAFYSAKNSIISPNVLEYDIDKLLKGHLNKNKIFQDFCSSLKKYTSTSEFKSTIRSNRKSELKREVSSYKYIDAHFEKYARLTVVRLDLHLLTDPSRINFTNDLLSDMARFWRKLRRDLRESSKIPNPEGFIGSLEHGHYRGFHFHVMLFFDGSKHQKGIILAKMIGEHWKYEVTKGRGDYHNCNATDPESYKYYGIGRVDHWNIEKIGHLKFAARYLAKTDYSLNAVNDNGARAFFRGTMPRAINRSGRPRMKLG